MELWGTVFNISICKNYFNYIGKDSTNIYMYDLLLYRCRALSLLDIGHQKGCRVQQLKHRQQQSRHGRRVEVGGL